MDIRSVCVFCGSSRGASPAYAETARALGRELGIRGLRLVYGGGNIGLMGVVAEAAAASGAEVVGVIPKKLNALVDHPELAELLVTEDMGERKAKMAELADAFVALPGGSGTLEELFEVWTGRQIGYHGKPIGLLDVSGYWRPFLDFLGHVVREGFLKEEFLRDLLVDDRPGFLLDRLASHPPLDGQKLAERRASD